MSDFRALVFYKNIIFTIYVVLMAVQIIPIEGYNISPIKVIAMSLAPFWIVSFGYFKFLSDAFFLTVMNLVIMIICASLASPLVAWDRIGYRAMYILMFICVYGIIYDDCIDISYLKKLLIILSVAYGLVFFIQHVLFLLGIQQIPILNYYASVTMAGVFKPNGLSCEPSHAARILTVIYWGILKLTEIEQGKRVELRYVFKNLPYCSLSFLFSMITMGSATGMIGILLILSYFFNRNIGIFLFMVIGLILMMNVEIEHAQIQRIQKVFNSLFSDDVSDTLKRSEGSGAVRIMPFINTFRMDLFSIDTWIGQGSVVTETDFTKRVFSETRYVGDITSFGLLSYIVSLVFVFKCCINKFFSMETLMFLLLATFSVGSVYYTWFMLMVFAAIKYYENYMLVGVNTKTYNNE